jgi:virulence-associated protein VagC
MADVSGICPEPVPEARYLRLFRNGRNQAVRIPVEFELPGDEAIMHRDGDHLVIEPVRKRLAQVDKASTGGRSRDRRPRLAAGEDILTRYLLDTNIVSDLIRNSQG